MTQQLQDYYYSLLLHDGASIFGLPEATENDQAISMGQVLALIAARLVQGGQSLTPAEILKLKTDLLGGQSSQVGLNTKNLGLVNTNLQALKRDTDSRFSGLDHTYVLKSLYETQIKLLEDKIAGLSTLAGEAKLEADEAIATGGTSAGTGSGGSVPAGSILDIETINAKIGAGKLGDDGQPILTPTNNLQQQILDLAGHVDDLTGDHSNLKEAVIDWTIQLLLTRYESFYFPPPGFDAGTAQMSVLRFIDEDDQGQQPTDLVEVTETIAESGAVSYRIAHGLDSPFLFLEAFTAASGVPAFINWGVHDPAGEPNNESSEYLWIHFKAKPEPNQFRILLKARPEARHTTKGALL